MIYKRNIKGNIKVKTDMKIREKLKNGILVFDGAMGTYFKEQNRDYAKPCEMANIDRPQAVADIHKAYIDAGCQAIKTNTFSVNPLSDIYASDTSLMERVILAGWKIAQDTASGTDVSVFADIGPVPAGAEEDASQKAEALIAVCDIFIKAGAENFIFETNSNDEGLTEAAEYIKKKLPEAFIIISFAVQPDGYTRDGMYINDIISRMAQCTAVDAAGTNCVSSALHMRGLINGILEILTEREKLLCVMPNAGYPKVINDRVFYDSDPGYFAEQVCIMLESGASIAGGCCGTTAEHIKALAGQAAAVTKAEGGRRPPKKVRAGVLAGQGSASADADGMEHNLFARKLARGEKVIAVELDPPRNADSTKYMSGAWALKAAGVDAITVADCATGRASMDSSIMSCKLRRELGIDTIPHMTCRDRNLNATKALLLALSTEGVLNVLTVTGDPVPTAERDEVKSVFQFNSRMLASYIKSLNENEFSRRMRVYGAMNINVKNFDRELERTVKKVENGMCGFLTQPVLTERAAENLQKAYERLAPLGAKVLGGIIPVVSSRNARFMDSEISGINVDPRITEMYEGLDRAACTELAVEISTEIARRIGGYVDGYYLMTPFSRTDIISRIVANIKEMETEI